MLLKGTQFGDIEFNEKELIYFNEGLLGFQNLKKFILVNDARDDIFVWIQSFEDVSVAFPLLESEIFNTNSIDGSAHFSEAFDYKISFKQKDKNDLEIPAGKDPHSFNIITISKDPKNITANLKAPVIINFKKRLAKQCILEQSSFSVEEPIFYKLRQRLAVRPMDPIKFQTEDSKFVQLQDSCTVS